MTNHCSADILLDSMNVFGGARLTTFLVRCPLYLYSRLLAHRSLVVTRCLDPQRSIRQVFQAPVMPDWGDFDAGAMADIQDLWLTTAQDARETAEALGDLGVDYETADQLLAPFQTVYVVISGTEWSDFFSYATEANDEVLRELAWTMANVYYQNVQPTSHRPGQWHAPLVENDDKTNEAITQYLAQHPFSESNPQKNLDVTPEVEILLRLSAARLYAVSFFCSEPVDKLKASVLECPQGIMLGNYERMAEGTLSPKWMEHVAVATLKKNHQPSSYQGWNHLRGAVRQPRPTFNYAVRVAYRLAELVSR